MDAHRGSGAAVRCDFRLRSPVVGRRSGLLVGWLGQRLLRHVYGKTLSFSGYIAVQEGLQLKPDELRGILIRIKNVGIGYYDQSMLDFRSNEGPRSRWITGEIYVHEGLEDA